mmetsp:Transcript_3419/g.3972  ORF Transcript_3419/g.3972 Transcript_3419/m.3972 type:complete len:84 (+) Transcript_3419:687-938(+)
MNSYRALALYPQNKTRKLFSAFPELGIGIGILRQRLALLCFAKLNFYAKLKLKRAGTRLRLWPATAPANLHWQDATHAQSRPI